MSDTERGTLVLVVGPSGVGKDSIIGGAAARFHGHPRIVFARRIITRPSEAGGEDHVSLSPADFIALRDSGRLMLYWQAHGLDYGLPVELTASLADGFSVVANVSRTVLAAARDRFPPVIVVAIRASPEVLALRLVARRREDAADIESRLRRGEAMASGQADLVIDNDGPLDAAIDRFAEVLRSIRD